MKVYGVLRKREICQLSEKKDTLACVVYHNPKDQQRISNLECLYNTYLRRVRSHLFLVQHREEVRVVDTK